MKRKKIVLDLDGVIADIDTAVSNHLLDESGAKIDYSSWFTTDTKNEEALKLFNNPIFWKNIKPFEDAWNQVNKWFSDDVDVHIVTARRMEEAVRSTEPWLDAWKINTLRPQFSKMNVKHKIIAEIDPLFVVEDNPHEVISLRSHGINCYLRKAWYNKDFWDDLPCIETLYELEI